MAEAFIGFVCVALLLTLTIGLLGKAAVAQEMEEA